MVGQATLRPLYARERDPVPIVQEGGWAPGPVWTAAENLAPTAIDPRTSQPIASRHTDYAVVVVAVVVVVIVHLGNKL